MGQSRHQAIVHFNNGGKLFKSELFNEALEQYEEAFRNDPTFHDVHFSIAKTLIKLKKYRQGIEHFGKYATLIPENKKTRFSLGLSDALIEDHKSALALNFLESLKLKFDQEQVFKYVPVLLLNNRVNEAIHEILKLERNSSTGERYNAVLEREDIPETIVKDLKSYSIVPRFFMALAKVEVFQEADIDNKDYFRALEDYNEQLEGIRKNKACEYVVELEIAEQQGESIQGILFDLTQMAIRMGNLPRANHLIRILESTNSDRQKVDAIKGEISNAGGARKRKVIRKALMAIAGIAVLSIVGHFGYKTYKRSDAYDKAISAGTISAYSSFLSEYGDNQEIHRLRQGKLYQNALSSNKSKDINELVRLYPQSDHLNKVKISIRNGNGNIAMYGIADENDTINSSSENTFLVPKGCMIKYVINPYNKVPITRVFPVAEDLNIVETTIDFKTSIFQEDFETNKNSWKIFNESKTVYKRLKNKGSRLSGGNLNLYHEFDDDKFVLSTTYLPKLERTDDFEIIAEFTRNVSDNGSFILFGATTRAFNFFGISKSGQYICGYNNWDKNSDNWINQTNGWETSRAINREKYGTNEIRVIKKGNLVSYLVNGTKVIEVPLRRWYGGRLGFGINDNSNLQVHKVEVFLLNRPERTNFIENHVYYCWVDKLNVRDGSSAKGNILTTIRNGEPVKYLGEAGEKEVNATFRETYSPDFYYKVELVDGTVGWVHGGALHDLNTDSVVDFGRLKGVFMRDSDGDASRSDDQFYFISVYAEEDRSQAIQRLKEIKGRGFEANYLWIPDYKSLSGTNMFAVYVGPFSSSNACKKKLKEVKKIYPNAYGILASKQISKRTIVN